MVPSAITNDLSTTTRQPLGRRFAEVLLILLVFFIVAGDPPPHVNEAHYLSRLKHYWNPNWCAGDLFLESKDAQLVFVWTFGWVTRLFSLPATAWIGRLLAWTLLASAWQRLSWRLVPRPLVAALSAALFVTLNEHGHLAGEWVVGGVEAKCFAYGFVLLALRELLDRHWNRLWLLLGAATAFHPLVGGLSIVVCGGIWLLNDRRTLRASNKTGGDCPNFAESAEQNGTVPFSEAVLLNARCMRSMLPGLVGGGLMALLGVLPALMLTWNEPPELVAEASRIYVFERLPHHLAPLTLPAAEVFRRLAGHAALLIVLGVLVRAMQTLGATGSASARTIPQISPGISLAEPVAPINRVAQFAWGAALLAIIGFAIELALWNQPLIAARLLRYYWFRLTDFAAPMAVAICATALISAGMQRRRGWAVWALTATLVLAGGHLSNVARQRVLNPVPPADAKMRDFDAWVEACAWVAENTPADALFLTPRLNHTFKWRAGRPEIVNRKDVPQDARGIIEWHRRIKDIYYATMSGVEEPLDSLGILGTEQVRELAIKYGADFVLMDRGQLLSLPIAFWNEEYVVYRIEDGDTSNRR